jgi:Family of unknown function (DUF6412)
VIATVQGALVGVFGHLVALKRTLGLAVFGCAAELAAFGQHVAAPAGGHQSGLMVLAAITLTGVLVALLAQGSRITAAATEVPLGGRAAALRAKAWRAGFLPQRDPDARGRARPRAPTASPVAA